VANWPLVRTECGDCKALVEIEEISCGDYCKALGLKCVSQGEEVGSGCEIEQVETCDTMVKRKSICECGGAALIVGVDCVQSDWIPSGACSVTCGEGTQTQTRSVLQPAERGGTCGPDSRTVTCTNGACPAVDCVQSGWVRSGACSVTCGEGTQTQIRSILHQAKNGGASCGPHSRTVTCRRGSCSIFSTSSTPQPASGNNCPRWCETGRKPWAEKCQNFKACRRQCVQCLNQSQSLTTSFIKKPITIKVFASIGFISLIYLVAKAVFSTPDYEKIPGGNI